MLQHTWLLLVHQLPPTPSNLRVRTWRRLQQLGAVAVKQAVYALPDSPAAREDFEWLKTEIKASGGDASVFAADHVDTWSDDALVEEFRRQRQDAYATLARDVERALRKLGSRRRAVPADRRVVEGFRQRLASIQNIDFFGSPGAERVVSVLKQLEGRTAPTGGRRSGDACVDGGRAAAAYSGRFWVTRPRPGVDRMASAWLIRHAIDPAARFGFARDADAVPPGAVPFDMFGVEFSHSATSCTVETLVAAFGIDDAAIARVAAIVHDLDLKDDRFGSPENPAVAAIITGLQLAHADDDELLAHGMTVFDALYRAFDHGQRVNATAQSRSRSRRSRARKPPGSGRSR